MLAEEILPSLELAPGQVGVLLAGDFYTVPGLDKRGGTGDVRSVWQAFADAFDWVAGVAGNHDLFGETATRPNFAHPTYFLDGDCVEVAGLSVAGLSGIPGNPRRPWRRPEDDFIELVEELAFQAPDILIVHEGPEAPESGCRGSGRMRQTIEQFEPMLVVRGHSHWRRPLAELSNAAQVLNVDARVVILTEK